MDDIIDNNGLDHDLTTVASSQSFSLVVTDESMLPTLKVDDIVVIDPVVNPQPGEIVAAKLKNEKNIILRKYRPHSSTSKSYELIALNEDWPRIFIQDESQGRIIGTLIEHRCRRRVTTHK